MGSNEGFRETSPKKSLCAKKPTPTISASATTTATIVFILFVATTSLDIPSSFATTGAATLLNSARIPPLWDRDARSLRRVLTFTSGGGAGTDGPRSGKRLDDELLDEFHDWSGIYMKIVTR